MNKIMKIKQYLTARQAAVDKSLDSFLPEAKGVYSDHFSAMRYSLFVGGKRLRPILCLAAAEAITNDQNIVADLLPTACALECIHTYSLIHDDLPAMDNDDLRRGKPTNHKIYGEAAAILAGDSLLTYAFELLTSHTNRLSADKKLQIANLIARASGPEGMAGGQSLDIANENQEYPFDLLKTIHRSKTGALIKCSVEVGAIGADATREQVRSLKEYGIHIGLAFQIIDDLLDATSTTEILGKTAGSDQKNGKATYPSYFGVDKTRQIAQETVEAAKSSLSSFDGKADPLRELADYIASRTY